MQFFRDLSIGAELFAGFGLVLIVAVAVGIVLISEMSSINSGGDYVATDSLPSVRTTTRIAHDAVDYRRAQVRYVLESAPSELAKQ